MNARLLPLGDETASRAWTPAVVKPEHLRALTPLVADRAGKLTVVTPNTAADGYLGGERRVSVETLLADLNGHLRSGRSLLPAEETPSKALPGPICDRPGSTAG
ncbi:hypothetical protein [Streptomyces sp. CBMA156]|uniref:hypothetical protein n=1 Tax=Streptomyces sp. CBMA156 TaxID=1930280 RepID=UPI001661A920|nr:hypothetical protein [Streptomyces sp. CBMA156]